MKINLGCGEQYANGWINIDRADTPHNKDLAHDIRIPLPYERNSIMYCYAGHVFEHLRIHEVIGVLTELQPKMHINGELMVIGPDIEVAEAFADAGIALEVPLEQLRYGAGRWAGDIHRWECSSVAMMALLRVTGWIAIRRMDISEVPEMWPVAFRGPKWQFAVTARRGDV